MKIGDLFEDVWWAIADKHATMNSTYQLTV